MMPSSVRKIYRDIRTGRMQPEDLPNDPIDRCGYFFLSTGPNDPFIPCCKIHDDLYVKAEGTRLKADRIFLECMLDLAGDSFWLKLRARTYYRIVRAVGWAFW